MEIEKDEYRCSVSLSMVYDPVNIVPTAFLYDRNTVETLVEKNPRNPTIPQTREPFVATDITPNADLREEMRRYFQGVMGNEYTGWEVIPDYPQLLSLDDIRNLLGNVLQFFPTTDAEENLRRMSAESLSNAWKRLTFLRLNLQMNAINRQIFLADEQSIKFLLQFIVISYTRRIKTDESDLFHREILRTIRALDLTTDQERIHHLNPENEFRRSQFTGFVLRQFLLKDEGLQPVVFGLLSLIAETLEPTQLFRILSHLDDAEPVALSSTNLKKFALILDGFFRTNFTEDNSQLILKMQKYVVKAFVQIVIYAVGIFESENRIGVVEDACEALRIALFDLHELIAIDGPQQFLEPRLAFSIHMDLLTYIHEIIEEAVEQESPHWIHLSADHWSLVLNIAKILYQNVGNADIMTNTELEIYLSFLNTPIASDSELLTDSVNIILDMFLRFVGLRSRKI